MFVFRKLQKLQKFEDIKNVSVDSFFSYFKIARSVKEFRECKEFKMFEQWEEFEEFEFLSYYPDFQLLICTSCSFAINPLYLKGHLSKHFFPSTSYVLRGKKSKRLLKGL